MLSLAAARAGTLPDAQVASLQADSVLRRWGILQGLPESKVESLALAPDGRLWAVTPHCLVRFDGSHFDQPLENPSPEGRLLRGVWFDARGRLWLYGAAGAWYHDGTRWQSLLTGEAQLGPTILELLETSDQTLYALSPGGIYRWKNRVLQAFPIPKPARDLCQMICSEDPTDGLPTFWIAAGDRVLRWSGGVYQDVSAPQLARQDQPATRQIFKDRRGRLWTATRRELLVFENQSWHEVPSPRYAVYYDTCGQFWESSRGELWIASKSGLSRSFQGAWAALYKDADGETAPVCHAILEDAQGSIWVGTDLGLLRVSPRLVRQVPPPKPISGSPQVSTVHLEKKRQILVGYEGGEIFAGDASGLKLFSSNLPRVTARALLQDDLGFLWIGSNHNYLWRARESQFSWAARFGTPEGIKAYRTQALVKARDGTLFAGTNDGLRICAKPYQAALNLDLQPAGGPESPVAAMLEDADGSLWIGYESQGLWHRGSDGKMTAYSQADGLPGMGIFALCRDAQGVLWLGGPGGLARWDKTQRFVLPAKQGLSRWTILQMLPDTLGNLWLGTTQGIWRLSRQELARMAQGQDILAHPLWLAGDAGMTWPQCTGSLSWSGEQPDTQPLYFGTRGGLVSLDPASMRLPAVPPKIALVWVGQEAGEIWKAPPLGASGGRASLVLPPGLLQLSIGFCALDLAAPDQLRFRYRLCSQGAKPQPWSELSPERRAVFDDLAPGHYRFEVMALSAWGCWSEEPATLELEIQPRFWQRFWFWALLLGLSTLLTGLLVRGIQQRRFARRMSQMEREAMLQRERQRIARDLHDDLGAGLSELAMLGDAGLGIGGALEASSLFERIYQRARELTQSVDEIVWAMNPRHDTLESLVLYLSEYAQDLLSAAAMRCRLDLPMALPEIKLHSTLRHETCLAVKESLSNVIRHSGAKTVELKITLDASGVTVIIADDGRGFDPAAVRGAAGHDGLENMAQRMKTVGGCCAIQSAPAHGTRVILSFPVGT